MVSAGAAGAEQRGAAAGAAGGGGAAAGGALPRRGEAPRGALRGLRPALRHTTLIPHRLK